MKKIIFIILFLFWSFNAYPAELLVKARPHLDYDKLSDKDKERLTTVGDIIVVKPDGWKWGKRECLPEYIVIKIPDLKYEEAKKYKDRLTKVTGGTKVVVKDRKWQIPVSVVDQVKLSGGEITLNKTTLQSQLIEKK